MYEVSVEGHFDAAHYLREYGGKCEALHGHRYKVVARVTASQTDKIGLAYDFTALKKHLAEITSRYDHACLNDLPPFDNINPSSENIAATIYNELKPKLAGSNGNLTDIEVWESPDSWVLYRPD
jgi:6-pyruvoyltetrahydropterin/6-carboxytetrahydropterin synthase